ncbi:MAG: hypothetical protein ABEJ31_05710 [Haloarculaceae archaeon]
MTYQVSCAECDFEERMETVSEILERQERHREDRGSSHVLEFDVHE